MTNQLKWAKSQNGPKRGFFTLFGPFSAWKRSNGSKILFLSFSFKNHFQKGVTCLRLTKSQEICFLASFSGPKMVKMAKKYCFHHFSSQNHFQKGIPRLCLTKSQETWCGPKRGFLTLFASFSGPKNARIFLKYISSHFPPKFIFKKGHMLMFYQRGPKWGLLALFGPLFGPVGSKFTKTIQNYTKTSWFWAHTISNEGVHVSTKFLKVVKTSYFEDFWDFDNPSGAK